MRPRATAFAPGRVNLIGEHTDYNGGLALPFAIERGVTVTAEAIDGDEIEAIARDLGESDRFPAADPPPATGWRAFVRGVVAEFQTDGLPAAPARLTITSDLERGAGLASSAALTVATALALRALAEAEAAPEVGAELHDADRLHLAQLCSRVENDWAGAPTGLLDQLASLHGAEGHALRIDFADLSVEPVPLRLNGWTLATVDSGDRHSNATSGYAERAAECRAACERLGVATLSQVDLASLSTLPEPLRSRARHVLDENRRVEQAATALRSDDIASVASLLDASHASLRDLYAASTPAVERTVAQLEAQGAAGARMVGGGFGGHVLALFRPGATPPPNATAVRPARGARAA
jgi:galactokinase